MCTSCSRRSFIGGLALLAWADRGEQAQAASGEPYFSCSLSYSTFAAARRIVRTTSGDRRLDHALISELREICKIMPVNPGFRYIVDDSPNAFAESNSTIPNTRGTVYIGLNLINSEMNSRKMGGIAVAGICAHECSHIYQFFSPIAKDLEDEEAKSGVFFELHADLMAGYYLRRRGWKFEAVQAFAESLFSIGDYAFNDPDHHGTPAQRVSAMRQGYAEAVKEITYADCAAANVAFVKGLTGHRPLKI